jgi:hypothetical protein
MKHIHNVCGETVRPLIMKLVVRTGTRGFKQQKQIYTITEKSN